MAEGKLEYVLPDERDAYEAAQRGASYRLTLTRLLDKMLSLHTEELDVTPRGVVSIVEHLASQHRLPDLELKAHKTAMKMI
jgi:hypothetical protein